MAGAERQALPPSNVSTHIFLLSRLPRRHLRGRRGVQRMTVEIRFDSGVVAAAAAAS